MGYIVLIYKDSHECRSVDGFEREIVHESFPQSLAPARASVLCPRASLSARPTSRTQAARLQISRLCSMAHQPLVRWLAAPIVGVPTVYSGYSTMLNFWHWIGVSPSLWLHTLAVVAGVTSGVAAIARLRS